MTLPTQFSPETMSSVETPCMNLAIAEIEGTYGHKVSIRNKRKSLSKFGRNDAISNTTAETIWIRGGHETYATGNTIDTISSSNAGDGQTVKIEGHTLSGSDLTFVVQTATLNGQTKVVLTTPLYRSSRMFNTDSTNFAGDVYVYEESAISAGVPDDTTKVHLKAAGDHNQSEKASTSLSSVDYAIITAVSGGVDTKLSASVEFNLQTRESGGVFRTRRHWSASSDGPSVTLKIEPHLIVAPNSDIRIIALASANNTEAEAGFDSVLAIIV